MSELVRRTFRITLDVTVSVNEIDEALIMSREKYLHDSEQEQDPSRQESIARDRRLLAAVLNTPHVLEQVLGRVGKVNTRAGWPRSSRRP